MSKYKDMFNDKNMVEHINDKHRKYHRIQFEDENLADRFYKMVKKYLPNKIKNTTLKRVKNQIPYHHFYHNH
jgi:hypothetical protein